MTLRVNDVEVDIVERLADGYFLHLLRHVISGDEDGRLRRSIDIIELIALWRRDGSQLLSTRRKELQRVVLDVGGKLVAHLRRHKRVGDIVLLEVVVQGHQIEAQLLWHDVYTGATGQGGVHIHHTGIKAITGIGGHAVLRLQTVETLVPMAEADEVAVSELAALGYARRTGGIEEDE